MMSIAGIAQSTFYKLQTDDLVQALMEVAKQSTKRAFEQLLNHSCTDTTVFNTVYISSDMSYSTIRKAK